MTDVDRVTALWGGFSGAPGYSRFSFTALGDSIARNYAGDAVHDFFDAIKGYLPTGVTIDIDPVVQRYTVETSAFTAEASMTVTPATVTGVNGTSYAAGAGVFVTWNTGVIWDSRRIRGRTFLVPLAGWTSTNGTPDSATITAVQNAGNALIGTTGLDLAVWAKSWVDGSDPPVQQSGNLIVVTDCTVKDAASSLRSRRT